MIDADASPSGYIAWYNHSEETHKVRKVRPSPKNERFGVQRMELLAIYFAIADNWSDVIKRTGKHNKKKRIIISIRSDSKSTIDQLQGLSRIRDALMYKIFSAISKLIAKFRYKITFHHLERSQNIAGILLEHRRRKQIERMEEQMNSAINDKCLSFIN